MTKKDLLEAIKDMPEDAEVWIDVCEYHSILRCVTKVDYDLRRVYFDKHLINALYFACKKLKEEGVI